MMGFVFLQSLYNARLELNDFLPDGSPADFSLPSGSVTKIIIQNYIQL